MDVGVANLTCCELPQNLTRPIPAEKFWNPGHPRRSVATPWDLQEPAPAGAPLKSPALRWPHVGTNNPPSGWCPRYFVRVSEEPEETPDTNSDDEIDFLRSTPVETVLGNYIFHLLQIAAVHLASSPPNLAAAQLAIDVVSAMVKTGDERLGEHVDLYRNAIAEVQQVYVRAAAKDAS